MEQIHTPKKPDAQEVNDTREDVVHALLAASGLQPKKSRQAISKSLCKKSKDCDKPIQKNSPRPKPEPLSEDALNDRIESLFDEGATNADERLRQFLLGERSFVNKHGEEEVYNPAGGRVYTLEEVGTIMGVTRERVRQIEENAIRKMWRYIRSMNMREDLTEDDWFDCLTSKSNDSTVYIPDVI